jgi:hypothetical protein
MQTSVSRLRRARVEHRPGPRYILVTQCLQNDFFRNPGCRLGLPTFVVRDMLLGKEHIEKSAERKDDGLSMRALARGPLGRLLEHTIGRRMRGLERDGTLHVVNIRDWHCPGASYDEERRVYGCHCEAGRWGAAYIDGLGHYLDPHHSPREEKARYFAAGSVRIYHIHSDTLFDFKPHSETVGTQTAVAPSNVTKKTRSRKAEEPPAATTGPRKVHGSPLEDLLDVIVEGSDAELVELHLLLEGGLDPESQTQDFHVFAKRVVESDEGERPHVYLGAIGVYTDIKINTVLTGVRTRYELTNVAVSDTFTTSYTLERHLAGLDFAKKVLGIEVIHGINDFVRFLGGSREVKDEKGLVAAERYASYQLFFQDQQNVLAYQSQRLQEYLALTERRALKVHDRINLSNSFLIFFGAVFLVATLGLAIASAVTHGRVGWELPAVTGGLSIAQFVSVFFRTPAKDLHENLTNLAEFRMNLESRSLRTAIIRFHLTTARTLRSIETEAHALEANLQIDALKKQLEVLEDGLSTGQRLVPPEPDLAQDAQADGDAEAAVRASKVTNGAARAEAG